MAEPKKIGTVSYYGHHINAMNGNVYRDKTVKHSDGSVYRKESTIGNIGPIQCVRQPFQGYGAFNNMFRNLLPQVPSSMPVCGSGSHVPFMNMYGGSGIGNYGLGNYNNGFSDPYGSSYIPPIVPPIFPTYQKPATSVTIATKGGDIEKKLKKQKKIIENQSELLKKQTELVEKQTKRLEQVEEHDRYLNYLLSAEKTKHAPSHYHD
jgi:hypothetical protein